MLPEAKKDSITLTFKTSKFKTLVITGFKRKLTYTIHISG
jgi:hypothetical protein